MNLESFESIGKNMTRADFGEDFLWGVATSAFQIEGGNEKDGRGASIWDQFIKRKKIHLHDDSFNAINHFENYKEDIALLKKLSIPCYRFSLSWSRIIPNGIGKINEEGIAFYHNIIDTCIANDILPLITLYHWDLPQALEEKGGWVNRDILKWFDEYVSVCINEYKSKVLYWMVLNEPAVFTGAGYFFGVHAPGKKGINNFLPAMHHALLCQANGLRKIKELHPESIVGTTFSCTYITPKTYSEKDLKAADRVDTLLNKLFIEPSLGIGYPTHKLPFLKHLAKYTKDGDDELLKADFDFIGLQNYTREVVAHNPYVPYINARIVPANKRNVEFTTMNWEIYPKSIYNMIDKFSQYHHVKKIFITENGASFYDEVKHHKVNDKERIDYIKSYLYEVLNAKQKFGKVAGYFVWSLLDNFEWAEGFDHRFGLIYVDHLTHERIVKNSGYWFKEFLES
jgi:beta-glucosidase